MLMNVVEGYGASHYDKHNKPLPKDAVDKIMLLYHNQVECCCDEVGCTIEEEEQLDSKKTYIDVYKLSESGEESKEHDSD